MEDEHEPSGDDEWDEEESILTWKLLIGIVVVLAVVAVVAMALFGKKSGEVETANDGTETASPATEPDIVDDFDRPDNDSSLGKTPSGEDWESLLGIWGVQDKQAFVAQKNENPRNIALLDIGTGDGSVGATAAKMVNGWGLVFRYRGPNAYWYIAATPLGEKPTSNFNLMKMVDGQAVRVASCLAQLEDGSKVEVQFSGSLITVLVDAKPKCTATDAYLQAQTKVGLIVISPGVEDARWTQFEARQGLTGPPVTAQQSAPTSAGGEVAPTSLPADPGTAPTEQPATAPVTSAPGG